MHVCITTQQVNPTFVVSREMLVPNLFLTSLVQTIPSQRQVLQVIPVSVKQTLLWRKPLPCNPAAETVSPAPALVLRKLVCLGVFLSGGVFSPRILVSIGNFSFGKCCESNDTTQLTSESDALKTEQFQGWDMLG